MRTIIPALALGLAIGAVSCASRSRPPETAPPAPTPASPASELASTSWLLTDLAGREAIDRVEATLSFDAQGGVSGNGSCNRFHGTATISGASITFGPLAATKMACAEANGAQEAAYLEALQRAERFEVDEPFLTIYPQGGGKPLKFIRAAHH